MAVVADANNTLALAHCEKIFVKMGLFNILIELYLSRRCYKRPLEILMQQYSAE